MKRKVQSFLHIPAPAPAPPRPLSIPCTRGGHLSPRINPHRHIPRCYPCCSPKPIRVCSWCCTCRGCRQTYDDTRPPLQGPRVSLSPNPLCSACSSLLPHHAGLTGLFSASIGLPFPERHRPGITQSVASSDGPSLSNIGWVLMAPWLGGGGLRACVPPTPNTTNHPRQDAQGHLRRWLTSHFPYPV